MSAETCRRSRAIKGALLLIAMPFLYVLTLPPMYLGIIQFRMLITPEARGLEPMKWPLLLPKWFDTYATPYGWLMDHTPMKEPLIAYYKWWESAMFP